MSSATIAPAKPARLTSLDQFRGYTMFGMLLVNFLGGYKVCPYILRHHHDYCSYADTIMPQFLFAAGFAMRLSLGRRLEAGGIMPWGRAIRRVLGLALVAILWYGFCDYPNIFRQFREQPTSSVLYLLFKRNLYQTLMHIAVTGLWILPVITRSWRIRLSYMVASGLLHVVISWLFNYAWVYSDPSGIDGGPLAFLTWSIPALCGSLACDAVRTSGVSSARTIALWGVGVMVLGWLMTIGTTLYDVPADQIGVELPRPPKVEPKPYIQELDPNKYAPDPVFPTWERIRNWDGKIVEPPFVPPPNMKARRWNYWMMSQRGGTLSYPTFAAGVSLVIFALFLWVSDGLKIQIGFFRTLGTNSLAAYMLPEVPEWVRIGGKNLEGHFPKDSSALGALVAFAIMVLFVYGVCRLLERFGLYIRV